MSWNKKHSGKQDLPYSLKPIKLTTGAASVFDYIIILMLSACVFKAAKTRVVGNRLKRWLVVIASGICAFQVVFEGPRLQLVPAYLVATVFTVLLLIDLIRDGLRRTSTSYVGGPPWRTFLRWMAIGGATIALLLSLVLCLALPDLEYPAPTGTYAVGARELQMTDSSREELLTESPDDHRQIRVRVSYPAVNGDAFNLLPQDTVSNGAALVVGALVPNAVTPSWGAMRTHAKRNAPVAPTQRRYPVLIFSHGMGSYPAQNTVLIEHLVSHGYVVMAINHSFLSTSFQLADGSMIGPEVFKRADPFPDTPQQSLDEQAVSAKILDESHASVEVQTSLIRQLEALDPDSSKMWADMHRLMADDQSFLLDRLSSIQVEEPLLAGHLDLDRVGVFGMSSGGTASHITCTLNKHCRAGLNMDGFQPLLIDLPPLGIPFMHMSSEHHFMHAIAHEQSNSASYVVRIRGSSHASFTDIALLSHRLKRLGKLGTDIVGTIDGDRVLSIINDYVLGFFNKNLLGQREPLLEEDMDRYPEVALLSKE